MTEDRRALGYYWVRRRVVEGTWEVAWYCGRGDWFRCRGLDVMRDEDFDDIDERRIERLDGGVITS